MDLYEHQLDFINYNPNKSALVHSCGTGKSRTALEWCKFGELTMVICPKALRTNWQLEAKKWGSKIVVYSKEEFRKEWDDLPDYSQVIVDEVHNGFLTPHFKSQMSKALRNYIKKWRTPRILLLSATVYTSSPWNIYQLATLLGYKWNWQTFNYKFFNQIRMGPRIVPVPKEGCEAQLAELTKKIASVVDIYDCMDVPLQQHLEPEYFSLTREQERAIEANYDPTPIVRFTLQHEIENGILIGNEFKAPETFKCDKNDRILDLCAENPKIAIICRYNAQIYALKTLLLDKGYDPLIINGDVKDRDAVCRLAEKSEKAIVIIQSDCAIGFELPSFSVCVFASMSYSYTSWEQTCGRFLRMNRPSRTTFIYLLTEGDSIDQAVYDSIKRKEDFKIDLYRNDNRERPKF